MKEINVLKSQNTQLVENSKHIQKKLIEDSELKSVFQNKFQEIRSTNKGKKETMSEPLLAVTQNVQVVENWTDVANAVKKTIPKAPRKTRDDTNSNLKIVKKNLINFKKPETVEEVQRSDKKRFLLPKREGASIEKLEKSNDELSLDSDDNDEEIIINKKNYEEEKNLQITRNKDKAIKKDLKKKEIIQKSTLNDILKLKSEIEEVTSTLRNLDAQEIKKSTEVRKNNFKQDLHKKLDTFQQQIYRKSFEDKSDERYIQSLRKAYEESSSDYDDELDEKYLKRKKEELKKLGNTFLNVVPRNRLPLKYKKNNKIGETSSEEEADRTESDIHPHSRVPKKIEKYSKQSQESANPKLLVNSPPNMQTFGNDGPSKNTQNNQKAPSQPIKPPSKPTSKLQDSKPISKIPSFSSKKNQSGITEYQDNVEKNFDNFDPLSLDLKNVVDQEQLLRIKEIIDGRIMALERGGQNESRNNHKNNNSRSRQDDYDGYNEGEYDNYSQGEHEHQYGEEEMYSELDIARDLNNQNSHPTFLRESRKELHAVDDEFYDSGLVDIVDDIDSQYEYSELALENY